MAKNEGAESATGDGAPKGVSSEDKKTPREWREHLCADPVRHATASFLHGWDQHEHHYASKPLHLTKETYESALDAGFSYPCARPCADALSPCVKGKFEKFKPAPKTEKSEKETQKRGKPAIQQPAKAERN